MGARKLIAIILIIAGALGLIYRGFSYTKESHEAKVGSLEFSVASKDHIDIPVWASVVVLVAGVGLLAFGSKS
jgi:divalent metal cation (Fe/Co/Zn/Cd) transporter